MNFSLLSDSDLHQKTLQAAENEKSATLVLLDHLHEVDSRRLFSAMGYSSLFEYVHRALGFSEPQSSERVSAMRLMRQSPQVKEKLESGELTLTTTARLASHIRKEKPSVEGVHALLELVSGKTVREVEKLLASESADPARPDRVRVISQAVTRITIEVDQQFLTLMTRVQELRGDPGSTPKELFKIALESMVKKDEEKLKRAQAHKSTQNDKGQSKELQKTKNDAALLFAQKQSEKSSKKTDKDEPSQKKEYSMETEFHSRAVPEGDRIEVRLRSGDQCEWIDPVTGRRCEGKMNLQYDHRQPYSLGGKSCLQNIRHLCANHNRFEAVQVFGKEKMGRFLKS